MSKLRENLVPIFEKTILRLKDPQRRYSWGHFGFCNCGHLAQTMTGLDPEYIHKKAVESGGDWSQRAREYCPDSGYEIDEIIKILVDSGLEPRDIQSLEELNDPKVLKNIPGSPQNLSRNNREHAISYLESFKSLMNKK